MQEWAAFVDAREHRNVTLRRSHHPALPVVCQRVRAESVSRVPRAAAVVMSDEQRLYRGIWFGLLLSFGGFWLPLAAGIYWFTR